MIAAGVSAYDGNHDPIEDPEVGTIKLIYKKWDVVGDKDVMEFIEIPTRPCLKEDFEGNESIFYPAKETSVADMHLHWKQLKCVDKETELSMFGRYDTQAGQNIMVVFEKCDRTKRTCKTDTDIHDWMV